MVDYSSEEELAALKLIEGVLDLPVTARIEAIQQDEKASDKVKARAIELLADGSEPSDKVRTAGAAAFAMRLVDVPDRIGAYRLIDEIGRGGMGIVYRAQRDAGDFEHEAAIKMILTGSLSQRLIERFRYERQTLASLNHPGIARLFDGGETEDDLPYLIMELVEGQSLRQWMKQKRPSREERFAVLDQLFAALQYAHSRLVIHRDLTPDNVVIDDNGQAKLIDFGLYSLQSLSEPLGNLSTDELFTGRSGTPGFSAPESGDKETEPGVALDVYALGKLIDFLFADVSDQELLAIIQRAAAEEPAGRYATVEALAADIHRLRTGQSVAAFNGGAVYKARKFVSRNMVPVGAATAVALAVIGALVTVTFFYQSERQARSLAEGRFDALAELSRTVMTDVYTEIDALPGSERAQEIIVGIAKDYLEQLEADPRADTTLRLDIADAHLNLAWFKFFGVADLNNDRSEAEEHYEEAMKRLRALEAEGIDSERFAALKAWARIWYGQKQPGGEADYEAALQNYEDGLVELSQAMKKYPKSEKLTLRKISLETGIAEEMLLRSDDIDATRRAYRQMMETADRAKAIIDTSSPQQQISIGYRRLSQLSQRVEKWDEAERLLDQAFDAIDDGYKAKRPLHSQLVARKALTSYPYANLQRARGASPKKVIAAYEEAIARYEDYALVAPTFEHPRDMIVIMKSEMAVPLAKLGRRADALAALRPQMDVDLQNLKKDPDRPFFIDGVIFSYDTAIDVHEALGDAREVCRYAKLIQETAKRYSDPEKITIPVKGMIEDSAKQLRQCLA